MFTWLAQNIGTILITLLLILVVGGIIFSMIRDKRKGKSTCGCSCANCKMCSACRQAKQHR